MRGTELPVPRDDVSRERRWQNTSGVSVFGDFAPAPLKCPPSGITKRVIQRGPTPDFRGPNPESFQDGGCFAAGALVGTGTRNLSTWPFRMRDGLRSPLSRATWRGLTLKDAAKSFKLSPRSTR